MQHTDTSKIDVNKIFENFNHEDYWKLFIDEADWSGGPLAYDNDESSGYLKNMTKALLYNFLTIESPVTLDLIIALHDLSYHAKTGAAKLGLTGGAESGINLPDITVDGLKQLIQEIKSQELNLALYAYKNIDDDFEDAILISVDCDTSVLANSLINDLEINKWAALGLVRQSSLKEIIETSNHLIRKYYSSIDNSKGKEDAVLKAIAKLISHMHKTHLFDDGNGRTFIFLLLNKLLLQNNLTPTIITNPARFTTASLNELVEDIKKGQNIFKSVMHTDKNQETSFLDFLKIKVFGKLGTQNEVLTYLEIDPVIVLQDYPDNPEIKSYLDKNITHFYLYRFMHITDKKTIDFLIAKIPPMNKIDEILSMAITRDNPYLFEKILNYVINEKLQMQLTDILPNQTDTLSTYLIEHNEKLAIRYLLTLPEQMLETLMASPYPKNQKLTHLQYLNLKHSHSLYHIALTRLELIEESKANKIDTQKNDKSDPEFNALSSMRLLSAPTSNNMTEKSEQEPLSSKSLTSKK